MKRNQRKWDSIYRQRNCSSARALRVCLSRLRLGDRLGTWGTVEGTKLLAKLAHMIGSEGSGPAPLHPGQMGGKDLNFGTMALTNTFVPILKP